jgi:hypothetical protein
MLFMVCMMGLHDECRSNVGFVAFGTKQSSVQQSVLVRHWILCFKYQSVCCMTVCMTDPLQFECECWIDHKMYTSDAVNGKLHMRRICTHTTAICANIPTWGLPSLSRLLLLDCGTASAVEMCVRFWCPLYTRWNNQLPQHPCRFTQQSWNMFWFVMKSNLCWLEKLPI